MQTGKSKRCPRCGGNIFIDEDEVGDYMGCLQCGYEQQIRKMGKVQVNSASVAGLHSSG